MSDRWCSSLLSCPRCLLNFVASYDGIRLRPARGSSTEQLDGLIHCIELFWAPRSARDPMDR